MKTQTSRNKLKTPSYFIKRLRDNGFIVIKLFSVYSKADSRRWTVMVNPSERSVMITCYNNKESFGDVIFELNDGGANIPKNMFINTSSIEVRGMKKYVALFSTGFAMVSIVHFGVSGR